MFKLVIPQNIPDKINPLHKDYLKIKYSNFKNARKIFRSNVTITDRTNFNFDFSGYTSQKKFIRKLANYKCSYCGTVIDQSPTVVEHYRPKNRLDIRNNEFIIYNGNINTTLNKTSVVNYAGYFLDGNNIYNMMPSCYFCNSSGENKNVYIRDVLVAVPFGKNNFFPIRKNKFIPDYRYQKNILTNNKNETPLLFNPYIDNPLDLFEYKKSKKLPITYLRPKRSISRLNKLKATLSISLLGLNRKNLCEERYEINKKLNSIKNQLFKNIKNKNKNIYEYSSLAEDVTLCYDNSRHGQGVLIKDLVEETLYLVHLTISSMFKQSTTYFSSSDSKNYNMINSDLVAFSRNNPEITDDSISIDMIKDILEEAKRSSNQN